MAILFLIEKNIIFVLVARVLCINGVIAECPISTAVSQVQSLAGIVE